MAEDSYAVVYPGDDFPKGAVRALGRGLDCNDNTFCDVYVALWIREDGEAVFGKAWNYNGKVQAAFPWGGKEVLADDTKGFRILTYVGPQSKHEYKYRWVRAKSANSNDLLYVGEYTPVVVHCANGEECLGKAQWTRRMAWTSKDNKEEVHDGTEFDEAHLLCRIKTSGHGEK